MPATSAPARPVGLYRLLLIGAAVLALVTSAQHYAVMQLNAEDPSWRTVRHALNREVPFWFLWVLASPLVALAVRRVRFERRRLAPAILAHVGLALLLVLAHTAALLAVYRLTGWPTPPGPFWQVYVQGVTYRLTIGLMGYATLFGSVVAFDYYTRFRERELAAAALAAQLAEARLQTLRMQLNPHFLYNAMNTISMLVRRQESVAAVRMLAGLSDLLRTVLEESPPQEVPLGRELAFIERYLEIERQRFPDRLRVTVECPADTADALVPSLVLQPLVENAIKHGVSRRAGPGSVTVTARRAGEDLVLEVRDDGAGPLDDDVVTPASGIPISSAGIGLRNTADRLARLYGARGRLELLNPTAGGAIARVTLPFRPAPAASEAAA